MHTLMPIHSAQKCHQLHVRRSRSTGARSGLMSALNGGSCASAALTPPGWVALDSRFVRARVPQAHGALPAKAAKNKRTGRPLSSGGSAVDIPIRVVAACAPMLRPGSAAVIGGCVFATAYAAQRLIAPYA